MKGHTRENPNIDTEKNYLIVFLKKLCLQNVYLLGYPVKM